MHALKVIVPGEFYDSQIYNGRLYLWEIDGSLITIDWDKLVGKINVSEELEIALKFALQHNDALYRNPLLRDIEVRDLMQLKFKKLSELVIEVNRRDLLSCRINQRNSPFPFPHADSAVHYDMMYVGSQDGVSASECIKRNQWDGHIESAEKILDLPVLSIATSHLTLAIAAGNEGLFDYSLTQNPTKKYSEPRKLSGSHCNLTRWLYPSIFGSSYFNDGYFADFETKKNATKENVALKASSIDEHGKRQKRPSQHERILQGLVSSDEIFKQSSVKPDGMTSTETETRFTWGVQDKLCSITKNSVKLAQYKPKSRAKYTKNKFKDLGSVEIEGLTSEVISADSSLFGIVLEQEDGLLIVTSLLESHFLQGEPVNWRVFPKATNYSNHLHVIYDDALHIYAFSHDYFVDQFTKKLGITVTSGEKLVIPEEAPEPSNGISFDDIPF